MLYHSIPTLIQFFGQDVDERVFEQLELVDLEMLLFVLFSWFLISGFDVCPLRWTHFLLLLVQIFVLKEVTHAKFSTQPALGFDVCPPSPLFLFSGKGKRAVKNVLLFQILFFLENSLNVRFLLSANLIMPCNQNNHILPGDILSLILLFVPRILNLHWKPFDFLLNMLIENSFQET